MNHFEKSESRSDEKKTIKLLHSLIIEYSNVYNTHLDLSIQLVFFNFLFLNLKWTQKIEQLYII